MGKINKMMRTLSLSHNDSDKENDDIHNDQKEVISMIVSILNNDEQLNRDKLLSKLNEEIANNDGINWRRTYQPTLGKFDEFIMENDRFNILSKYKRNFIVELNDETTSEQQLINGRNS